MASPPPVIPITANCGSHMRDPYGAGPPVSARHHANTERGCTGLLRSYAITPLKSASIAIWQALKTAPYRHDRTVTPWAMGEERRRDLTAPG